jgi:hypothetical protein
VAVAGAKAVGAAAAGKQATGAKSAGVPAGLFALFFF